MRNRICQTPKNEKNSFSNSFFKKSKLDKLNRRYHSDSKFFSTKSLFEELYQNKEIHLFHDFSTYNFFEDNSHSNFNIPSCKNKENIIEKKNSNKESSFSNFITYLKEQESHFEKQKKKQNQSEILQNHYCINENIQNEEIIKEYNFHPSFFNNKSYSNKREGKKRVNKTEIKNMNMINKNNNNLIQNNFFYNPHYQNSQNFIQPYLNKLNYIPYNYYNQNVYFPQQNYSYFSNNNYNKNYKTKKFNPTNKIINQNYNNLSNEELAEYCHIISKYQSGCRYLQMKIDENPDLVENLFFPNILCYIHDLTCDQYSVFFIKKIICYLNEEKLLLLFAVLLSYVSSIGINQYGTKILQYLIDYLKTEKLISGFIKIILPHIILFINDNNGVLIIEKLLSVNSPLIQNIHNIIFSNITEISMNKNGCFFLRKYFEIASKKNIENMIVNIEKYLNLIITDQYGNYIIQSIINLKNDYLKEKIVNIIILNINFYSKKKFSSNVVEKCLDNIFLKNKIVNEIMKNDNFKDLLLDKYGNYVIQKAINITDEMTRKKMFELLIPLIPKLKKCIFGQKFLSKLALKYPIFKFFY